MSLLDLVVLGGNVYAVRCAVGITVVGFLVLVIFQLVRRNRITKLKASALFVLSLIVVVSLSQPTAELLFPYYQGAEAFFNVSLVVVNLVILSFSLYTLLGSRLDDLTGLPIEVERFAKVKCFLLGHSWICYISNVGETRYSDYTCCRCLESYQTSEPNS